MDSSFVSEAYWYTAQCMLVVLDQWLGHFIATINTVSYSNAPYLLWPFFQSLGKFPTLWLNEGIYDLIAVHYFGETTVFHSTTWGYLFLVLHIEPYICLEALRGAIKKQMWVFPWGRHIILQSHMKKRVVHN